MRWLLLILLVLIILHFSHRVYFNVFTHSLPQGIYLRVDGPPQRGDYATTCLDPLMAQYGIDRGYLAKGQCATGTVLVLKMIKGIAGDHYVLRDNTLILNGIRYPLYRTDSLRRPLKVFYKQGQGVLDKEKYFLISTFVKNSWDSRYWGPVSIQFLLKPFVIWGRNPS